MNDKYTLHGYFKRSNVWGLMKVKEKLSELLAFCHETREVNWSCNFQFWGSWKKRAKLQVSKHSTSPCVRSLGQCPTPWTESHEAVLTGEKYGLVAALIFLFYLDILEEKVERWYHMSEIITMLLSLSMTKRKVMTLARAREDWKQYLLGKKKRSLSGNITRTGAGWNHKILKPVLVFQARHQST